MTIPARVQLSRRKGFRLQDHAPGAIVVRRPTRWGNPFAVADAIADEPTLTVAEARERCTWLFDLWLDGEVELTAQRLVEQRAWILEHLHELASHPLACTCPLPEAGQPDWCHAAVLIRRSHPALVQAALGLDRWVDFGARDDYAPPPVYRSVATIRPAGQWAHAL